MAKVKKFVKVGRPVTAIQYFDLETASRFGRGGAKKKVVPDAKISERMAWTIFVCLAFTVIVLLVRS